MVGFLWRGEWRDRPPGVGAGWHPKVCHGRGCHANRLWPTLVLEFIGSSMCRKWESPVLSRPKLRDEGTEKGA